LTERLVDRPEEVLGEILEVAKVSQMSEMAAAFGFIAEEWSKRNGIQIHLRPEAAQLLSQRALESGDDPETVFAEIFKDYEHGLNLVRRMDGIQKFEITEEAIRDPKAALDQWIRSYYITRQ
jgi:hypothetical protein